MRPILVIAATLFLVTAACSSDNDSTGPGTTFPNGSFSGTVNGAGWAPVTVAVNYNVADGIVSLVAADAVGSALTWTFNASGAGTYSFATGVANIAGWLETGASWNGASFINGTTGSVTFSTLTSTRAAGSFSLSLVPASGGATGTRTISGTFDIVPNY